MERAPAQQHADAARAVLRAMQVRPPGRAPARGWTHSRPHARLPCTPISRSVQLPFREEVVDAHVDVTEALRRSTRGMRLLSACLRCDFRRMAHEHRAAAAFALSALQDMALPAAAGAHEQDVREFVYDPVHVLLVGAISGALDAGGWVHARKRAGGKGGGRERVHLP